VNISFLIAKRYLSKQKGSFSSFIIKLAIVATALSVAVMIFAVCIVSGFKRVIKHKLYDFWGHAVVVPYTENPNNIMGFNTVELNEDFVKELKKNTDVRSINPFIVTPAILQANDEMEGIRLKGIDHTYNLNTAAQLEGKAIQYNDSTYAKELVISQATAKKMHLKTGDDLLLYFVDQGVSTPRVRKLKVVGIYHTGLEDIDEFLVFCDLRLLQHMNGWASNQINGYQVQLSDLQLIPSFAEKIYNNSDFTVQTIEDTFPGIIDWLNVQNTSVTILIVIMGIVAMISMGAALIILIVERASVTGLLKALGLTNTAIERTFLYIALLIGIVGVVIGNVFAITCCFIQQKWNIMPLDETIYFMKSVPIHIEWIDIIIIDVATIFVSIICMYLPTRYVRNQLPAKVLRFK
jgi:lipoprotein-releasing system permease protein